MVCAGCIMLCVRAECAGNMRTSTPHPERTFSCKHSAGACMMFTEARAVVMCFVRTLVQEYVVVPETATRLNQVAAKLKLSGPVTPNLGPTWCVHDTP
jgi:hypothetical protein